MNTNQTQIHSWEHYCGYKYPYTYHGMAALPPKSLAEQNPGAFQYAMSSIPSGYGCGTCDICGRAITYNFLLEDANGTKFSVGSSCIQKSGNSELYQKSKLEKRDWLREQKRIQRKQARIAKLDAERKQNNGLTNYELQLQQREQAREQALQQKMALLEPHIPTLTLWANILYKQHSSFFNDIANGLENGQLPYGRGQNIMIEKLSKHITGSNRANSKANQSQMKILWEQLKQIEEIIDSFES